MPLRHTLPDFLDGKVTAQAYERWLSRKATAHVKRDRKRGNASARAAQYKEAIHGAVLASKGRDAYTGEDLDWSLLSKYRNDESKALRYKYKAQFSILPTVDHCLPGGTEASFCICAWRTNDAKNDLSLEDFINLCRKVVAFSKATE